MKKKEKTGLLVTYPWKGYVLLESPKLDPEIKASFNDSVKKRENFFFSEQNLVGLAISAIGSGFAIMLAKVEINKEERDSSIKYHIFGNYKEIRNYVRNTSLFNCHVGFLE